MLSMIAAQANNRAIGFDNKLLFNIPADMAFFKAMTRGKRLIAGRKTYESILTYTPKFSEQVFVVGNGLTPIRALAEARSYNHPVDEIVIIGGASLYEFFMSMVDKIYLTEIETETPGDSFFPIIPDEFVRLEISQGHHFGLNYSFSQYIKCESRL